jgi:hypothetical protein
VHDARLRHSHSIVNGLFLRFKDNSLIVVLGGNTMKNTMLKKSGQMPEKLPIERCLSEDHIFHCSIIGPDRAQDMALGYQYQATWLR